MLTNKDNGNDASIIIQGILAGCFISFGALLSLTVTSDINIYGFNRLLFGTVFPLGLILTVLTGAELFTGNIYKKTIILLHDKLSLKDLLSNWFFVWFLNFIGALLIVLLVYYSNLNSIVISNIVNVADVKVGLSFSEAFARGILCNWLVCLGVFLAGRVDNVIEKIICIWLPVMSFAALGFEHSIANMFIIPLSMCYTSNITLMGLFSNLIPVTLGNILGGVIFVACAYYYISQKKNRGIW